MAEAAAAFFMSDINCGAKSLHSGLIKVDKYSLTLGDLLNEEIPEGYLITEIFISQGEGKTKRHVLIDMVFGNLLYMKTYYRYLTLFVTKTG